mmetsp:Transcript_26505/g.82808  ORF Transcript_26505/g.82808 Transcript_26505/m.82808 type:complete len:247 (-) Transcript_26505:1932-2672(-)
MGPKPRGEERLGLLAVGLLQDRCAKPLATVLEELGTNPDMGLLPSDAAARRDMYGVNSLTPPHGLPQWLCCLLPCLLQTQMMQLFNEMAGEEAGPTHVLRGGRWLRMDAMSLVPGDVVQFREGQRCPADVRVLRSGKEGLRCDLGDLIADAEPVGVEGGRGSESLYEMDAAGMSETEAMKALEREVEDTLGTFVPLGAFCSHGKAIGVVVDTGDETLLGELISTRSWPPPDSKYVRKVVDASINRL